MNAFKRGMPFIGSVLVSALALTGCMSSSAPVAQNNLQPQNLAPVQSSSVSSAALPPLAGSQPNTAQISPGLSGTPVLGGAPAGDPTLGDPTMNTASADGSFVTLNDVGTMPNANGRDLSGGLSYEKLLGGWNVVSGASQCRLNLTYTAKAGTSRYRASAPACQITGLAGVASWALVGNGVQLFDEAGSIVAALQLSGNRFIGTVAGGAAISMAA
jgi:hypothetical protein